MAPPATLTDAAALRAWLAVHAAGIAAATSDALRGLAAPDALSLAVWGDPRWYAEPEGTDDGLNVWERTTDALLVAFGVLDPAQEFGRTPDVPTPRQVVLRPAQARVLGIADVPSGGIGLGAHGYPHVLLRRGAPLEGEPCVAPERAVCEAPDTAPVIGPVLPPGWYESWHVPDEDDPFTAGPGDALRARASEAPRAAPVVSYGRLPAWVCYADTAWAEAVCTGTHGTPPFDAPPFVATPLEAVLVLDAAGAATAPAPIASPHVRELGRSTRRHPAGRGSRLVYRLALPAIGADATLRDAFDVAQAAADAHLAPLLTG